MTNLIDTGPTGITFDVAGNVYVSDLYSGHVAIQFQQHIPVRGDLWQPRKASAGTKVQTAYTYRFLANNINVFTTSGGSCSPGTLF